MGAVVLQLVPKIKELVPPPPHGNAGGAPEWPGGGEGEVIVPSDTGGGGLPDLL